MIYLATPFWHKFSEVREARYHAACKVAAYFIFDRLPIYCPVVHCYHIDALAPRTNIFWIEHNLNLLGSAKKLIAATIPGYLSSSGMKQEMKFATANDIPVELFDVRKLFHQQEYEFLETFF